jgi:hypothetical protein
MPLTAVIHRPRRHQEKGVGLAAVDNLAMEHVSEHPRLCHARPGTLPQLQNGLASQLAGRVQHVNLRAALDQPKITEAGRDVPDPGSREALRQLGIECMRNRVGDERGGVTDDPQRAAVEPPCLELCQDPAGPAQRTKVRHPNLRLAVVVEWNAHVARTGKHHRLAFQGEDAQRPLCAPHMSQIPEVGRRIAVKCVASVHDQGVQMLVGHVLADQRPSPVPLRQRKLRQISSSGPGDLLQHGPSFPPGDRSMPATWRDDTVATDGASPAG